MIAFQFPHTVEAGHVRPHEIRLHYLRSYCMVTSLHRSRSQTEPSFTRLMGY
jgi:hypothetical protein